MDALAEHPVSLSPNPFDESVTMEAQLKPLANCRIEIFSMAGRCVRQRTETADGTGKLRFVWKATEQIPAGIYLIRISSDGEDVFARAVKI
jgi:hypothetical protein